MTDRKGKQNGGVTRLVGALLAVALFGISVMGDRDDAVGLAQTDGTPETVQATAPVEEAPTETPTAVPTAAPTDVPVESAAQETVTPTETAVSEGTAATEAGTTAATSTAASTENSTGTPAPDSRPASSPAGGEDEPTTAADASDATPSASASGTPIADEAAVTFNQNAGGGGGTNRITVNNRVDARLQVKADIQLNQIPGPTVSPTNAAIAYGSCTDCQTLGVALQINLISRTANRVTPENAAVAINVGCTRCQTMAIALQYVISVDDPRQVPKEVNDLIKTMDAQLKTVANDPNATLDDAVATVDSVIGQFRVLAADLDDQRDLATEESTPGATPLSETDTSA